MSLMDAKGTLSRATKDLLARWQEVREQWSDAQAAQFEKEYLQPLEQDVRNALTAMDQMNSVMSSLEKDCE